MCLNETYSRVRIGKKSVLQVYCSKWPETRRCFINTVLEYAIRRVKEKQEGLKLNGTHQLLAYVDVVNILGVNIHTIQKNTEVLLDAGKEVGLEANSEKSKYMLMSSKKAGQKHSIKIANRSFEGVANSNIWEQHEQIKTACRKRLRAD
jgi:hypothetical protein